MDMMSDQETPFIDVVEQGKDDSYYQGLGIHILKQFDTTEHYYHFLCSVLTKYDELNEMQQTNIKEKICIYTDPKIKETIISDKKIIKAKKVKKVKPKINTYDDY